MSVPYDTGGWRSTGYAIGLEEGVTDMGDKGQKDKAKHEQQAKKAREAERLKHAKALPKGQ